MPEFSWDEPLGPDLRPLPKYPALDFLRKVEVWQQPGTGSVPVSMPSGDAKTLRQLLKDYRREGAYPGLEGQARTWLIGYRELSPMLNEDQSAQLNVAINGQPKPVPPAPRLAQRWHQRSSWSRRHGAISLEVLVLLIIAGPVIWGLVMLANS